MRRRRSEEDCVATGFLFSRGRGMLATAQSFGTVAAALAVVALLGLASRPLKRRASAPHSS